ncbi:MAG: nucleotidyl transferase AbiEii/AbiGii toxin family protein [Oscillospiraceae bacterium]|nr:nucleotidyl transferase AbiEii/AbiGii toxin family protein [Oscillospiraceae bacterium]
MITERTFTQDWLLAVNKSLGWNRAEAQLKNLERAIAALYLLERLVTAKLEFIFKGGTSLLLLLRKIYRLSVDIDIIIEKPIADTDGLFARVCSESKLFTRFERQERNGDAIFRTEHYKFFYKSFADTAEESYILLDVYKISNPYANTLELELVSNIVDSQGKNVTVRIPDADSILGDKLTAFAPDTIGISLSAEPGHRPKRVEVLKQLFDIGNLFNFAENVANIRKTYNAVASYEIEKFGLEITPDDALMDSERHTYIIGYGGKVEKPVYDTISKGYKDFNKFVSDLSFDENQAILAAAKTAYLVRVLLSGGKALEKYDGETDMGSWSISEPPYLDLNDYKYSNPEAFFYWYKARQNSLNE